MSYSYWLSLDDLFLGGSWKAEWESYISGMPHGGIKLTNENDSILWSHNTVNGEDSACLTYGLIVSAISSKTHDWIHA